MPPDLQEALRQYQEALAALEDARDGSSVSLGGNTISRQALAELQAEVDRWSRLVVVLSHQEDGRPSLAGGAAKARIR